jgi:hypothetical protein
MPHDHPGFDYWDVNDPNHPFPVGDLDYIFSKESAAAVQGKFTLPNTQPTPHTVAERYMGIVRSAQFWAALECTTDAQGNVTCEAVLRAKHLYWYPEHAETEAGPVQEVRLSMAQMQLGGRTERLVAHGPHCDELSLLWGAGGGTVWFVLSVTHYELSVDAFIEWRDWNKRELERAPPGPIPPARPDPTTPVPVPTPTPVPTPVPKPDPGPVSIGKPPRPGGLLGLVRRVLRGLFG